MMPSAEDRNKIEDNSNRSILKGISIFGGVQIFQILINLVRGKFVAMILGPQGMGVSSLLYTSATTIQTFSSLGINFALVREIAAKKNDSSLPTIYAVANKLIYFTAVLGALFCFSFSHYLSNLTFGSPKYTIYFMFLSIMVFFSIAGAGKLSILQGLHEVKRLSRSSIVGGLTGLFVGVPLYYLFGENGIVPAMIVLSISMFVFYNYSLTKACKIERIKISWKQHNTLIKNIIILGLILMGGTLVGNFVTYLINLFVRTYGSIDNVGLYQAANSITNQYVGIVFTSMSLDYFPRLTQNVDDNDFVRDIANRQIIILLYVITPLIIGLILTAPLLIQILLSEEFKSILELMRWMGFGILFRAFSFPLGYITFAKDNRKVYFWTEIILSNTINLLCSCIAYYYFNLIGLGITVVITGILSILIGLYVNHKLYGFSLEKETMKSSVIALSLCLSAFLLSFIDGTMSYLSMTVLMLMSATVSYLRLKKMIK